MSMTEIGHVVPELILVIGAGTALLFALFAPRTLQWAGALIALATIAAAGGVTTSLMLRVDQQVTMSGTYALDGVALWAKQIILAGAALVVVLAPQWFRTDRRHGDYYPLLLLTTLGAVLMAAAADMMELVMGVLLSSVGGYTLAAFHRRSALSVEAGMKFFLVGGLTNALLLFGVMLLFGLAGTTLYEPAAEILAGPAGDPVAIVAAVALLAVGLAFKLGAVPAHAWMPDVAQGAPAPSAAFLTVIPKVGALIAIVRLLSILPPEQVGWRPLAAVLAAATMTLGNLAALWQDDVRRLLGWSAVSQSGYGLMAVVAIDRSDLAVPALLAFLAAYTLANLAAFSAVTELRGRTALDDYAGLARQRPWVAAALAVSLLSLVGIPPLLGFTAKLALFSATIDAGYTWLAVLAVVNTVVSLFYYLRVLAPVYFDTAPEPIPVLGPWAAVPTLLAAAGVLVAGIAAEPLLARFSQALLLP